MHSGTLLTSSELVHIEFRCKLITVSLKQTGFAYSTNIGDKDREAHQPTHFNIKCMHSGSLLTCSELVHIELGCKLITISLMQTGFAYSKQYRRQRQGSTSFFSAPSITRSKVDIIS